VSNDAVVAFLEEGAGADPETAAWAAGLGQGSIGRALGFLPEGEERGPLEKLRRRAYELVAAALSSDAASAHAMALGFPPAGARGLVDLFAFVEEWLRDLAAVASDTAGAVWNRDARAALERLVASGHLGAFDLAGTTALVQRARELAQGNVNPQLVVYGLVHDLRGALGRSAEAARA
jgi:hypothetical protein